MLTTTRTARRGVMWLVAAVVSSGVLLRAHEITYQGTVLAVEASRVEIKTVDENKKDVDLWCVVDRNTKGRRGEKNVTFAEAAIAKGERIVVTIDHDAKVKSLATLIRLPSR